MRRIPAVILAILLVPSSLAQVSSPRSPAGRDSDKASEQARRAAFVDRAERTPSPEMKGPMPLRQAVDRLSVACDVQIDGLWTGRFDPGLDPDRQVDLRSRPGASCMEALENLLQQIDDGGEPVLWQATRFGLEIGPRSTLWRPRAIETRTYEVKDLLLRAPSFRSTGVPQVGGAAGGSPGGGAGGGGSGSGSGSGSGGGAGGGAAGGNVEDPAAGERRTLRTEELVDLIQRSVEPEAWQPAGGPCSIAARDGVLVIRAPDFVHRRIDRPTAAAPRKPRDPKADRGT